jgi:hypothetical protein
LRKIFHHFKGPVGVYFFKIKVIFLILFDFIDYILPKLWIKKIALWIGIRLNAPICSMIVTNHPAIQEFGNFNNIFFADFHSMLGGFTLSNPVLGQDFKLVGLFIGLSFIVA